MAKQRPSKRSSDWVLLDEHKLTQLVRELEYTSLTDFRKRERPSSDRVVTSIKRGEEINRRFADQWLGCLNRVRSKKNLPALEMMDILLDAAKLQIPGSRSLRGHWKGTAEDIPWPKLRHVKLLALHYSKPLGYEIELDIKQREREIWGDAIVTSDETNRVSFSGTLQEKKYVFIQYVNKEDRFNDYGYSVFKVTSNSERLEGFFLGRDRGQEADIVLGEIALTYQGESHDQPVSHNHSTAPKR
jgi:hypothetical protein